MATQSNSTNSGVQYWLKPEQVEAMRDAAHGGNHGLRDDALVAVLYDTGLRRGELAQVRRTMLDLEEAEIRLPGEIQKEYPNDNSPKNVTIGLDPSGQLRTVRSLRSYLNQRDDDLDALFRSRKGNALSRSAINDAVKRCARRAGVEPHSYHGRGDADEISAHTLRHSVAWRMLRAEKGNTLYDVRNRLRHATILTTERKYDHFQKV